MKKRGSAMLFVVLIIAVLFTLSLGVIQITLASLRHSSSYYSKNQAFYYADSSTDKALYYLDMIADKAREYANDYCFTESGALNLSKDDIKVAYDEYLTNGDRHELEKNIRKIFVFRFSEYLKGRVHGSETIELDGGAFNGNWQGCRDYIINKFYPTGNKSSLPNIDLEFYTFEDFKNSKPTEYNKLFQSVDESKFFSYPQNVNDSDKLPKETIITKVYLKDSNTLRYMITAFEFNPFDKNEGANLTKKEIKRGYNGILDYAIVTGRNLIVVNGDKTLNITGDIYVKGTGNDNTKNYTSDTYGGILVGMNQSTLDNLQSTSRENRIENLNNEDVPKVKGKIVINGNVYAGGLQRIGNEDQVNSGYVRTVVSSSEITITGDLYCNSIVTDETARSSKIDVKNVYISDNISLYGDNSQITVDGDLFSFEKADSPNNFNSSSSIIVDAEDAKLTLNGRVVLFGVAFIDELIDGNNIFKTMETTAINPNYSLYNFNYYDIYNNYFSNFKLKDATNYNMDMFDTRKSEKNIGKAFILDTLYKSKETLDFQYNFGTNIIDVPNIKAKASDSYFPFFFVSNGRIYMSGNTNITLQNNINTIKDRVTELEEIPNTLERTDAEIYADNKKNDVIEKLKFRHKGIDTANGFENYLDFSKLTEISIDDPAKKILIITSRDNIKIDDFEKYKDKDYSVLLISEKNIILDCNDPNTSVKGNIICKGDLIIKGGFILEQNKDKSKELMNYYNIGLANKCNELYRVFAPGTTAEDYYKKDIYSGIKKQNVKTNIDIISKRQMIGVK